MKEMLFVYTMRKGVITIERFSKPAAHALERSLSIAEELGHTYMGTEHLLFGLLKEADGIASRLLITKGITPDKVRKRMDQTIGRGSPTLLSIHDMTPRLEQIITHAGEAAHRSGCAVVGTDHLLISLCETNGCMACRLLNELGCDPSALATALRERMEQGELPLQNEKSKPKINKNLSRYAVDLTKESLLGRGHPLIGREKELEQLMCVLVRQNKNNPCLIGEPGVGKTVIVEGLAQRIMQGKVPAALKDTRIHMLDLTAMIAGTKYRGEFEERLRALLEEAERDPSLVLFIDEMHILVGAGAAEGAIDAANILKPALARGRIKVIGATTLEEYRRHIEKDGALERRFAPIMVEEPSEQETMTILQGLRSGLETHHAARFPDETLRTAIRLSVRYMGDRFLPDKAIDLLDEAGAREQLRRFAGEGQDQRSRILQKQMELDQLLKSRRLSEALAVREELEQLKVLQDKEPAPPKEVLPRALATLVAEKTGIPLTAEDPEGDFLYAGLEKRLSAKLIGQPEAVHTLAAALMRSKTGVNDPRKPACTLLFCGPTGVGKTRLARLLAKELFGKEEALIKYDMGEYMEAHSVSRLIGSPPGYIGCEQGGGLVSKVRNHPYAVILFDEIEKAHPDVLNILLGVLDEGRLTDGQGKTADFRNAILILTSNLGTAAVQEDRLGFGERSGEDLTKSIRRAVSKNLRPEFINRLDEIVVFHPLEREALEEIAALHLRELEERLRRQGHKLRFHAEVAREAAARGYDRRYGARAVHRLIEQEIGSRVAEQILAGTLPEEVLRAEMLFDPLTTMGSSFKI